MYNFCKESNIYLISELFICYISYGKFPLLFSCKRYLLVYDKQKLKLWREEKIILKHNVCYTLKKWINQSSAAGHER